MAVKQLSVFVENKTGRLREVICKISETGVNIRAMSIAETKDYGILRLIVSDIEKAKNAVLDDGCLAAANDVIAVEMNDEAGSLANILKILGDNDIDIDYLYAFTAHTERGAYVVLRVTDNEIAEAALKEKGVVTLCEEEIKTL